MFKNLNAGAIGIHNQSLHATIMLAQKTGFAGIDFDIRAAAALADAHGVAYVRDLFTQNHVRPGQWGLPVAWNQDQWQADLADLPRLAALGVELGCRRTATWCPSWSESRDYAENYQWHIARYRPIAEILRDHGCSLGIEFLGPKTLWASHPYKFIASLGEMMQLAADIGTGNVGLLLDAWHLYTSGDDLDVLDSLTSANVVSVHINDAPVGIPRDELADTVRCLPLETGVIDLVGFMRKLAELGYDGPVTTEPFNQRLNDLAADDPQAAAQQVSHAMDRLWQASGL
ncbi:sugar phosphate isomerase/epimerase family protein [Caldilinea sp.]|uniref:sugar phosphate isomerase/epimerase family protein n=1 Tax=Caldilinea sp. TaxID=2293560 RepID=UPI002C6B069F|nr:sugar phosphate isomerase/epimerase [Anaerolineales bacterium]HQY93557.1 sugar phosphate isomerase/epimerase family protein [Caldilinea sp.]